MSSYKALFVVVLAAACSQVRVERNARRWRPPRGGGGGQRTVDFSISHLSLSLIVGLDLLDAQIYAFCPPSFRAPSKTPGPLSPRQSREEAALLLLRWGLGPMLHRAVAHERGKRAFCRCFFFEKRLLFSSKDVGSKFRLLLLLHSTTNTHRPSPRPGSMSPRSSRPRTRRSTPCWRARTARSRSCASAFLEKEREAHLFSMVSSSSSTMHSPSSSSRLFFFPSLSSRLLSLSLSMLQINTQQERHGLRAVPEPQLEPGESLVLWGEREKGLRR